VDPKAQFAARCNTAMVKLESVLSQQEQIDSVEPRSGIATPPMKFCCAV
jgi:hypothetical protein